MNRIKYSIFLTGMVLFALSQYGCKKKDLQIGEVESQLKGIQAHWVMVKAVTIDEKSPTRSSFETTDFYSENGTQLPNITFNSDQFTYTCDVTGVAINHLGTSGTWKFDDNDYPSSITLSDAQTGMSVLSLYGPIRPSDTRLKIGKTLYCDDGSGGLIPSYTLILEFERK